MTKYLIVAHQTAESDELRAQVRELAAEHADAEFTLLVPATPAAKLFVWEEGENTHIAERRAESARRRLSADGIKVVAALIGDPDPHCAVADELLREPRYTSLVVGTLPAHLSHWLRLDFISWLRRHAGEREVIHVVAAARAPRPQMVRSA